MFVRCLWLRQIVKKIAAVLLTGSRSVYGSGHVRQLTEGIALNFFATNFHNVHNGRWEMSGPWCAWRLFRPKFYQYVKGKLLTGWHVLLRDFQCLLLDASKKQTHCLESCVPCSSTWTAVKATDRFVRQCANYVFTSVSRLMLDADSDVLVSGRYLVCFTYAMVRTSVRPSARSFVQQ